MKDKKKTKDQLINELVELRQRIAELEASEAERKRAEEALNESEKKYRNLVDNALVGIYKTNLKGDILYTNEALLRMLEFDSLEEMMSVSVLTRYKNPEDREVLIGGLKTGRISNFQTELLTKTGKSKNVILNAILEGDIISGMIIDITDRKWAEEALLESEKRYRTIFEDSREAIYITTREGRFIDFNQSVLDLFGYSKDEMMGLNARQIYANPADRDRFQQEIEQMGSVRNYEVKFRKKDGAEIDCLLTSTLWKDHILFKPSSLTPEEIIEMQKHCEIGHRIAMYTPDLVPIADLILKHHEWWNGEGYPLGIKGEEIPLECRILSICETYEIITSDRPYHKAMSHEEAVAELRRRSGTKFDPDLVSKFILVLESTKN